MNGFKDEIRELKNDKFKWIELSLVSVTAGIILLTQGLKSPYFLTAIYFFIIISIFNTFGILYLDTYTFIKQSFYADIFLYNSIKINVILLSIAFIFLAIGSFSLLSPTN